MGRLEAERQLGGSWEHSQVSRRGLSMILGLTACSQAPALPVAVYGSGSSGDRVKDAKKSKIQALAASSWQGWGISPSDLDPAMADNPTVP